MRLRSEVCWRMLRFATVQKRRGTRTQLSASVDDRKKQFGLTSVEVTFNEIMHYCI